MPEADFTPYVDLTIFNKTATDLYNDSVEYAKTAFPEFTPRQGTVENAILEAVSVQTESLISTINRLPDSLMEGILKLMGVNRITATASQVTIKFDVTTNSGVTISGGTVVSFDVFGEDGTLTQYFYETTEDLEILSGNTSGTVSAVATDPSLYPTIPVGSALTLISTSPFILSVELASFVSSGSDTELDADYFNRGVRYLASLSTSLATESQVTNYISFTYPNIAKFKVYDLTASKQHKIVLSSLTTNVATHTTSIAHGYSVGNSITVSGHSTAAYNGTYSVTAVPSTTQFSYAKTNADITSAVPTSGKAELATGMNFSTSDISGFVTIALCDSDGEAVSETQKTIIREDIQSKVVAGLTLGMYDMETFQVAVSASVVAKDGFSTASVGTAVSKAIEDYLSIAGWTWLEDIDQRYLSAIASRVAGVEYVDSISSSLPSATSLATASGGNITILKKGAIPIGECTTTAV